MYVHFCVCYGRERRQIVGVCVCMCLFIQMFLCEVSDICVIFPKTPMKRIL